MSNVWAFVLLSLAAYRLQRLVTTDAWPPTKRIRDWFEKRMRDAAGYEGATASPRQVRRFQRRHDVYKFITCPWCAGSIITFAVFAVAGVWVDIPTPVLQALAAATVVGFMAEWLEREEE